MADLVTPTKETVVDCCFCFRTGAARSFQINGKRCCAIKDDLMTVFGTDNSDMVQSLIETNIRPDAGVTDHKYSFPVRRQQQQKTCCSKKLFGQDPNDVHTIKESETAQKKELDHSYHVPFRQHQKGRKWYAPIPKTIDRPGHWNLKPDIDTSEVKLWALHILQDECKAVCTKDPSRQSVLISSKKMTNLADGGRFHDDIIDEMEKRTPFLFDILCTICNVKQRRGQSERVQGALVSSYSLLMFTRNPEMSAFQRVMTALCVRAHADDMLLSRLNKVGITMSTTSKHRLLDEAAVGNKDKLIEYLRSSPLLKITGDNLDIYIKTGTLGIDNRNKDLHLFASNALTTRVAKPDMDNVAPNPKHPLTFHDIQATVAEQERTRKTYSILISRIVSTIDSCRWMESVLPTHIPHPDEAHMSERSQVFQLPIQLKNESKYEDVLDIMDTYEITLQQAFREAHGNLDMLEKYRVVVGGDQLTKVRFAGASNLRRMSPTATGRLEHLDPIVCELWHLKQDFLDKCYKTLFSSKSQRQEGTLSFFANRLLKSDVTGKVKGKFQSHSSFLKLICTALIKEQALEILRCDPDILPDNIEAASRCRKERVMFEVAGAILERFGYLESVNETVSSSAEDDHLYNYCCNLCNWGLHLLQLDDTAREGDLSRIVPNLKTCIPFFYSNSKLSKYLFECVDYIAKCQAYLSPLNKIRVLEGSFVNTKGGAGNNVEADLVQEHHVKLQKELIRGLGANKTTKAIERVTAAASVINLITGNFDFSACIAQKGSRHTRKISEEDVTVVEQSLHDIRPFRYTPGRRCVGFQNITKTPIHKINKESMASYISMLLERLARGYVTDEIEDDEETSGDEGDYEELPQLP